MIETTDDDVTASARRISVNAGHGAAYGLTGNQYTPFVSGMVLSTTPTQAEKAEVVLAILLGRLQDSDVLLYEGAGAAGVTPSVELDRDADDTLRIRVAATATFDEVLDALHTKLANCRGRVLR